MACRTHHGTLIAGQKTANAGDAQGAPSKRQTVLKLMRQASLLHASVLPKTSPVHTDENMSRAVQCYFLSPTRDAPNNKLPAIHYSGVIPGPHSEESVTEFLTANKWEKRVSWRDATTTRSLCWGCCANQDHRGPGAISESVTSTQTATNATVHLSAPNHYTHD